MQHHHAPYFPALTVVWNNSVAQQANAVHDADQPYEMDELDRRMNAELNAREHVGHMPYQLDLHTIEPMPRGRWELTYDLYELLGMLRLLNALCRKHARAEVRPLLDRASRMAQLHGRFRFSKQGIIFQPKQGEAITLG